MPTAWSYEHKNLNITSLPSSFFDIVWNEEDKNVPYLTFNNFNYFFQHTDKNVTLNNFMKGCFAYHWHNRWNDLELRNSYAGKLNAHIDEIIEQKYNFKPYKIF